MDNVVATDPDIGYFREKLARQIEQFCRASRRQGGIHPSAEDINELFRATEKTRKQVELLEDSVVIHHLENDGKRNVWYINVKKHPEFKAAVVVKDFKEWLKDRKLP